MLPGRTAAISARHASCKCTCPVTTYIYLPACDATILEQAWMGRNCICGRHQEVDVLTAGYSADQQGLLYLRNSITNFKWYQQTVPCQGWDTDPVGADDICTWDGVGCNAALQVTSISFNNNAFLLEGAKPLPPQHLQSRNARISFV